MEKALSGILAVRAEIPEEALTAPTLGSEREGSGICISKNGLVLTIGYLVTEARRVWLIDAQNNAVEGHVLAYDQRSGFGLVQALGQLQVDVLELGDSDDVVSGQQMYLAAAGGKKSCIPVSVVQIRQFAGYWEYMIDAAIFTEPAHHDWSGAALIDEEGCVFGLGSLVLQTSEEGGNARNMIIPINLYSQISEDLTLRGGRSEPPRPWLGWYVKDSAQGPLVIGLVADAPAMQAGLKTGDSVAAVNGRRVSSLSELYSAIWNLGEAGITIDLAIKRDGSLSVLQVVSVDRASMLWRSSLH